MTTQLQEALLNDYQRDFPLVSEPFSEIAKAHKSSVKTVLKVLKSLKVAGKISRVGPVFRPNTIGVSTLAAMKIPQNRLEQVADLVNRYPEVNHNYEREHAYNLWFVATAPDKQHLENTLRDIEKNSALDVMRLPLVEEFHIDLGFNLSKGAHRHAFQKPLKNQEQFKQPGDFIQQQLIARVQAGLPLVERPYEAIALSLGITEQVVITRLEGMLDDGVIRRLGVVVRHRELGYRANAMLVWDFADGQVAEMGKILSTVDCVTLCYQRPRRLPQWPYNLFTMIHGKDKASVERRIAHIIEAFDLQDIPRATLFSKRCFKQCGARYRSTQAETHFQSVSNG